MMPSLTNGTGVDEVTMRYSVLPDFFDDSQQVGSDWYTLSVSTPFPVSELLRTFVGRDITRV